MTLPDHLEKLREAAPAEWDPDRAAYVKALEEHITGENRVYQLSELRDPTFFGANKDAILRAAREGRILDDIHGEKLMPKEIR